jgi:peptidyl-prolyl cis-trans isomerase SurA
MKVLRLFVIAAVLLGPQLACAEVVDRIIAIINDDIVTLKEVERYVRIEQQGQFVSVNEYFRNIQIRERINTFIDDVLMRQQAKKMRIEVSDKEVSQIIDNVKKQNLVTEEQFKEQLKKEGISYSDFLEGVRMNLLRNRVLTRVISPDVKVTDEMTRQYFEKHREELRTRDYRCQQIFISGQRQDAQQRAAAAFEALQQGTPFDQVAKTYSDDPSAAQGGDIGFVRSDELIPTLAAALSQTPVGRYTPVVPTPYGFIILKLNEMKQGDAIPYEALKDVLQERVVQEESAKKYREYLDKARESSYIEVKI